MFSRREMLGRMGTGLGIVGLAGLMADSQATAAAGNPLALRPSHHAPRAKHIIHLYMNGGPSHVDTFDPKPALKKYEGQRPGQIEALKTENRTGGLKPSPFKFVRRGKSGLEISELFAETGQHADDLCVLRSMYTDVPNHEPSMFMMNSGHVQALRPSYGSWLLYGLGTENQNLPGYVVLSPGLPVNGAANWGNRFLPGVYQGCHLNLPVDFRPEAVIPDLKSRALPAVSQRRQLDLLQQMNTLHREPRNSEPLLDARIASFEMAFRMQSAAPEAFDWRSEPEAVRTLYAGRDGKMSGFGMSCLLARRLVERGVRVVQIYSGAGQPWDTHGDNDSAHSRLCQTADRPIAALLTDLKRRGLLGETLVLWGGEFGRTPASQGTGRDHNHWGFSVWLAGGGIKGGQAYGATDEFGFRSVEKRLHVHDLHATMLHLMGLDHEKLTYRYGGRDFRLTDVHGKVVRELIA